MRYPGITDEVIHLLGKVASKRQRERLRSPVDVPGERAVDDIEMQGVIEAITTAFGEGRLALLDAALTLIVALTGRRPVPDLPR